MSPMASVTTKRGLEFGAPVLSCQNLWKLYGGSPETLLRQSNGKLDPEIIRAAGCIGAVRDVSLEVNKGEILVVMGLSGSGKSTLVRCLSLLVRPTIGEIFFEGQDLLAMSRRELQDVRRHKMGMVFQHFALLPHRTVIDNVAFPLEIQGISKQERTERAAQMVELVGLAGREEYFPAELSGGQQQRVGIARSLTVGPDLWFLDEPFSALDPLIRREMQDEFLRLQSLLNKTIIFITHDFDEAIRIGDRIAIMNEGEVVQIGKAEDILTSPANDYVVEFTQGISRERVLTVQKVLMPAPASFHPTQFVMETDTLDVAANTVLSSDGPVGVKGAGDDRVLGIIDNKKLAKVLYEN